MGWSLSPLQDNEVALFRHVSHTLFTSSTELMFSQYGVQNGMAWLNDVS